MAERVYRLSILVSGRDTGATSMLGGLGSALGSLATIAGGILTAGVIYKLGSQVVSFAKDAILSAGRVGELAIVNQVLAKNAGISAPAVIAAADAVRKMGIEAAVSQNVVAKFIQNHLDITKAANLARIAQDAAVISGQNSTEALDGMTQGLITLQPEVLRTYGLFVNSQLAYEKYAKSVKKNKDSLTTQEKQQALLNAVMEKGKDIAGSYEAAMESASKQIRSWPRYLNDISVAVGTPFQDAFDKGAGSVSKLLKSVIPMVEEGGVFYPMLKEMGAWAWVAADNFSKLISGIDWNGFAASLSDVWDVFKNILTGKITFPDIVSMLSDKSVDITGAFKKWMRDIDWKVVSDEISAGIDSIDWMKIRLDIRYSAGNIFKGIVDAAKETDWNEIGNSIAGALDELMGMKSGSMSFEPYKQWWDQTSIITRTGLENWQTETTNGIINWINGTRTSIANWQTDTINNIVSSTSGMGVFIKAGIMFWNLPIKEGWTYVKSLFSTNATDTVNSIPGAMAGGSGMISGQILSWLPEITKGLNIIKNEFIAKAQSWITQSTATINQLGKQLVDAVSKLLTQVLAAIVPITIKIGVDMPNFASIAAQVEAGLALLNGGGGFKGEKSKKSGGGGGGGNVPSLAGGGIARGPLSGFSAILHGTEAVVPLQGGSIPVSLGQLNPSAGSGGMVLNMSFVYAPMVSTASQHEVHDIFAPMIAEAARSEFGKRNL